jgi:hypothetical protein
MHALRADRALCSTMFAASDMQQLRRQRVNLLPCPFPSLHLGPRLPPSTDSVCVCVCVVCVYVVCVCVCVLGHVSENVGVCGWVYGCLHACLSVSLSVCIRHLAKACPAIRCDRCGRAGHMARECTKGGSLRCYECGENGHISKDCPM